NGQSAVSGASIAAQAALSAATTASAGAATPGEADSQNKQLSPTSQSGSESRRYAEGNTPNPSSTASSAGSVEVKVEGASAADQSLGQKVITELRADRS